MTKKQLREMVIKILNEEKPMVPDEDFAPKKHFQADQ